MKSTRKIFVSIFSAILLASFLNAAELHSSKIKNIEYNADKNSYTCVYKNIKRSFILCLPEKCNAQTSLVIMLHGLGDSAFNFKNETQFDKTALNRNYAVLFIDAGGGKNKKPCDIGWQYYDDEFSKNDVSFIVELAKACQKSFGLGSRVFAAGFSNGGFMVNKLAVTCSDFFTGAASVGGMMPKVVWNSKNAKNKIGYLQINGTKDDVVPMEFMGTNKNTPNPSMEKVLAYYAEINGISSEYETLQLSAVTSLRNYSSKVQWVIIKDGHHNWPSTQFAQIDTNSLILDFFDQL